MYAVVPKRLKQKGWNKYFLPPTHLGSYSVKLATSSRSTTTISLRTLLSTSLRFTVGTPTN